MPSRTLTWQWGLNAASVPETVGHFGADFGRAQLPRRTAQRCASTGSDRSHPSRPLQARCVSPNPFSVPSSLLYALAVLRPLSILSVARSITLFVHWPSRRRRRRNCAPHFSLRSTQRRRRVASPPRTARSRRGSSKSPSKRRSFSGSHILALTRSHPSILSRRFHTRFFTRAMRI